MGTEELEALVERMAAGWNRGDLEFFVSNLTDDVVWDDPAMPEPAVGREAVRAFGESVLRAFPDFHCLVRHPICTAVDGSRCAVPWTITGTSLAALSPPGFAATGKSVEFHGVDLLEIQGQRVKRIETYFDVLRPAEQLLSVRLHPAPGSLRQRLLVWAQRARAAWVRRGGFGKRRPDGTLRKGEVE
jgi:steroid delta-isomerase-like uncharacterized protein